jgi:hypothetical protein
MTLAWIVLAAGSAFAADSEKATATKDANEKGFTSIFDGKTLDGWAGDVAHHKVENGVVVRPRDVGGTIYTKKEYADFVFRFEFKMEPGGNNGIGLRVPPTGGDAAYGGMESQILDNDDPMYKNLQPYQYHGSIYGILPAKRGYLKPAGQWNSEEIALKGRHVKITLNGTVILEGDLPKPGAKTADGHDHPGLARTQGALGLLGHTYRVEFRNLRVKEL